MINKFNNKLMKFGNKLCDFIPPVYNVNILSSEHGSISASPVTGTQGTTVTLSNTPDTGYHFDSYNITGATLYDGNKFDFYKSDVSVGGSFAADGLTIDFNNQGVECTNEFLTQTKYPGVWTGYRVFRLGDLYTQNTHYYNYIKNLNKLNSNFTMYYFFAMHNNTSYSWGKAVYSSDSTNCVAQTTGWTSAGQDSQSPRYDKSRYRTVTVDVSKGGNINWDFYYSNDPWYGNSIYYAIPEALIETTINPK